MKLIGTIAAAVYMANAGIAAAQDVSVPIQTTICDISKDEASFDGKPVHVSAVFTAWWEGSLLADSDCPDVQYAFDIDGNDPTVTTLKNEVETHWMSDLIDYHVEFDAIYHDKDWVGGWNRQHRGVFEVTHVTSWTENPSSLNR